MKLPIESVATLSAFIKGRHEDFDMNIIHSIHVDNTTAGVSTFTAFKMPALLDKAPLDEQAATGAEMQMFLADTQACSALKTVIQGVGFIIGSETGPNLAQFLVGRPGGKGQRWHLDHPVPHDARGPNLNVVVCLSAHSSTVYLNMDDRRTTSTQWFSGTPGDVFFFPGDVPHRGPPVPMESDARYILFLCYGHHDSDQAPIYMLNC